MTQQEYDEIVAEAAAHIARTSFPALDAELADERFEAATEHAEYEVARH